MEECNKLIDEYIENLVSGKSKIIFVHPLLFKDFNLKLQEYKQFMLSTFLMKSTLVKYDIFPGITNIKKYNKEIYDKLSLRFICCSRLSLEDLYSIIAFTKQNPKERFIIYNNLDELDYYKLESLNNFYDLTSNIKFLNLPNRDEFNKLCIDLGKSLNNLTSPSNTFFNFKTKEEFYSEISNQIIKDNLSLAYFSTLFGFISLDEDDCVNWHKDLCKNLFNIPYTDFYKFSVYTRYPYFKTQVNFQSENNIFTSYRDTISFSRSNSYDPELKHLFNYSDLKNCFIPEYLELLYSPLRSKSNYFILLSQIKKFNQKYPQHFVKLVQTLVNKSTYSNPVTIIID